jgi:hydroxyacylglutathione hydrolase
MTGKHTLCVSLLALAPALAQAPSVESGVLPASWLVAGPNCLEVPDWQIHEYNPNLYILRESGCANYEKPFLYLFFGKERALLVDTGAGPTVDTAATVQNLIAKWQKRNQHEAAVPLVVAHSHGHGDHVSGDKGFEGMANVTLVPAKPEELQKAFAIASWPDGQGSIDLGDRVIDVLPLPGHQPAHVAYYDRNTAVLLTGDHLYPGRLYVSDFPAYLASTRRLVQFTETRPVAHILGCHIEQSSTPFVDYPTGTVYQPREHSLDLSRGTLLELLAGLEAMKDQPKKLVLRDITIQPQAPRPQQKKQ